jgi:hypothetical protein
METITTTTAPTLATDLGKYKNLAAPPLLPAPRKRLIVPGMEACCHLTRKAL